MSLGEQGSGPLPGPRGAHDDEDRTRGAARPDGGDELRQMALHLETAAVLEDRARRAPDPGQQAVLRRRAEHRRREAARLRARLADRGMALDRPLRSPSP